MIGLYNEIEIGISDSRKIIQKIFENYNVDFKDYAMSSFRRRIGKIIQVNENIKNVNDLLLKLDDKTFFSQFLVDFSISVTEMFRDPSFWRKIREKYLLDLASKFPKMRFWVPNISSGEELFSLLIVLKELKLIDRVDILASDISIEILNETKLGRIRMSKMQDINTENYKRFCGDFLLSDYYTIDGSYAVLDKSLMKNVSFKEIDLVKGIEGNNFHFVLCRNNLIYFNHILQDKVLNMFSENLIPGGFLAIGALENIEHSKNVTDFIVDDNIERIYKKKV